MLNHFSPVQLFAPHGLWPARLLCAWDSPGKNTGVGCHALLQGIVLTQGSNPLLLYLPQWQAGSLPLMPQGSPGHHHYSVIIIISIPHLTNIKSPVFWSVAFLKKFIVWYYFLFPPILHFLGFPCDSAGKESACSVGDLGSIPGLGRSHGEGKGCCC